MAAGAAAGVVVTTALVARAHLPPPQEVNLVLWVRQGSFALLLLQLTDFCV
jgi:hypothetical protein